MFLKTEQFEHNGATVTLSELSALQRIEHLAPDETAGRTGGSRQQPEVYQEDAIRTGAFLVAMSLWHNHPQKTKQPSMNEAVKQIEQEVLTTGLHTRQFIMLKTWCTGCPDDEFVVNNALNRQMTPGLQSLFLRESVRR